MYTCYNAKVTVHVTNIKKIPATNYHRWNNNMLFLTIYPAHSSLLWHSFPVNEAVTRQPVSPIPYVHSENILVLWHKIDPTEVLDECEGLRFSGILGRVPRWLVPDVLKQRSDLFWRIEMFTFQKNININCIAGKA